MTYTSYQHSYNNLLVELDRRRRHRDSTSELLANMIKQLDLRRLGALPNSNSMISVVNFVEDEIHAREVFLENHRAQLPDDLCLCIDDVPSRYVINIAEGDTQEEMPDVDEDLLEDVRSQFVRKSTISANLTFTKSSRQSSELIWPKRGAKAYKWNIKHNFVA